jgi:hypothetical protein
MKPVAEQRNGLLPLLFECHPSSIPKCECRQSDPNTLDTYPVTA